MKKAIFLLLSMFFVALVSAKEIINIGSGEWIPLTGKNLKYGGFCGHVVSEAFKLAGYETKIKYYPWKRVLLRVKEGLEPVTPCWIKSEKRAKDFLFSDTILVQKKVFFHRRDLDFDWSSIDELFDYRIGKARGYSYGEMFDRAEKDRKIKVYIANSDEQNLKKLLLGRIDLYPLEMQVGYTSIHKIFSAANAQLLTHHPKAILESHYYLMLSKKLPPKYLKKLLADFNKGLKALKDSGKYAEMEQSMLDGFYDNERGL